MLITCAACGTEVDKPTGQVNRAKANGHSVYCGRSCSYDGRRTGKQAPGWHENRFTPDLNKVEIHCSECSRPFWLPPSKLENNRRCSNSCNKQYHAKMREKLARLCIKCGKPFYPRPIQITNGQGRHCSRVCTRRDGKRAKWKLPKVLIEKITAAQKGRCAACKCSLKNVKVHVDHIVPFALGGKHVGSNVQVLCADCNLRKCAKDPIDFMQSMGYLI